MADFQEPEVEICASMLDALNECVQVCTSIYEVGVCIISNKMHFFLIFLFILGISVVLCLLAKPILTRMGPNEIVSFWLVTLHLKRFYLVLFFWYYNNNLALVSKLWGWIWILNRLLILFIMDWNISELTVNLMLLCSILWFFLLVNVPFQQ